MKIGSGCDANYIYVRLTRVPVYDPDILARAGRLQRSLKRFPCSSKKGSTAHSGVGRAPKKTADDFVVVSLLTIFLTFLQPDLKC